MACILSVQIAVAAPLAVVNSRGEVSRIVQSAIAKKPVAGRQQVGPEGFIGDEQADRRVHGGVDKAVLCYSGDHFPFWQRRYGQPLTPGAFGENCTITGLAENDFCIGDRWQIGTALCEVSQPRQPCFKLAAHLRQNEVLAAIAQTGFSGWYLRVVERGTIAAGDQLELIDRPHPLWSIARANRVYYDRDRDPLDVLTLASLPQLSSAWRHDLG